MDISGRTIEKATLSGEASFIFNAGDLPSGIYLVRLNNSRNESTTRKITLIR
jgi:hypothetical protein